MMAAAAVCLGIIVQTLSNKGDRAVPETLTSIWWA